MSAVVDFSERLELFFGAASDALARVYARLEGFDNRDCQLSGTLTGPMCAYAETLPATFTFVDRGPGESLLAEALVPEPCFWTPQMPHLYTAEVELRRAGRTVARVERIFGIRRLAASGNRLIFDGKSWVLRGVMAHEVEPADLHAWHNAQTALYARDPNDALCDAASRAGVLLVADIRKDDTAREIRRLRRWPAVGIIVVRAAVEVDLRPLSHNAMLAQRRQSGKPGAWLAGCDATIVEIAPGASPVDWADSAVPTIVLRPAGPLESVATGRAACDRLQRELAPHGQFAGYIV